MYCKDLLKRQRQTKIVLYCRKHKKHIDLLSECKTCSDFEIKRNRPIKKVSNKKITVTEETYKKVMQRDKYKCRLAYVTYNGVSCNGGLELHHIRYRSEAKNLINEPTNCIMLCNAHHKLVHSNKHYWQPILKEMIIMTYTESLEKCKKSLRSNKMTIEESINIIRKIDIRKLSQEEIEALKTIVNYYKNPSNNVEEIVTASYIIRNYKEER